MSSQTILIDDFSHYALMLLFTLTATQATGRAQAVDGASTGSRTAIIGPVGDHHGHEYAPDSDGFGFTSVLSDPRFFGVPILVLTTESSPEKKSLSTPRGLPGWCGPKR